MCDYLDLNLNPFCDAVALAVDDDLCEVIKFVRHVKYLSTLCQPTLTRADLRASILLFCLTCGYAVRASVAQTDHLHCGLAPLYGFLNCNLLDVLGVTSHLSGLCLTH